MQTYFLILIVARVIHGQSWNQAQCGNQWQDLQKCTTDRQFDYRKTKDLSSTERNDMKYKLRLCFKSAGCSDPFLSDREQQARQRCYTQFRDKIQSDLKNCIQRAFPDYTVPSDNDVVNSYGQDMLSMKSSTCKPTDKQSFSRCVLQARGSKGQNGGGSRSGGKRLDYCQVRCQCYQQSRMTQLCFDRSSRVRDQMCQCQRRLPVDSYRTMYRQCMQQQGFPVHYENQDYNMVVLNKISSVGGRYCTNVTDPCGGFRNQQCDQQRSIRPFSRSGTVRSDLRTASQSDLRTGGGGDRWGSGGPRRGGGPGDDYDFGNDHGDHDRSRKRWRHGGGWDDDSGPDSTNTDYDNHGFSSGSQSGGSSSGNFGSIGSSSGGTNSGTGGGSRFIPPIGGSNGGFGSFMPSGLGGSGSSSGVDASGSIDSSSFGTDSSMGIDPGNIMSGGSIMPDPSSVLSGATNSLGANLGAGGMDFSSILGNGFDPSSLFGNIGGGVLGGGANPTGGLLGGFDLSSIFSGKKK